MATIASTPTRSAWSHRRWLLVAAIALTALYVAVPVVMALDLDAVRAAVQANSPSLDAQSLDSAVTAVLIFSVILHAVSIGLLLWFTAKTLKGRRWARIALTAFLVAVTVGCLASWSAGLQFVQTGESWLARWREAAAPSGGPGDCEAVGARTPQPICSASMTMIPSGPRT